MQLLQIDKKSDRKTILGGGLSHTSKMPCPSYSLSATMCHTGRKLAKIKGSVCFGCYALKGNYRYPSVKTSHARHLEAITGAQWVDAMVAEIAETGTQYFRWHDSGDIQDMEHLNKIIGIARQLPDVKFWLPTKELTLVTTWIRHHGAFPSNLTVRVSAYMVDKPAAGVPLPVSTVSSPGMPVPVGAVRCLAPSQGGQCQDCRACWNADIKEINYLQH